MSALTDLMDLVSRMKQAEESLAVLAADSDRVADRLRLRGKAQGVALARGYVEELLRDVP